MRTLFLLGIMFFLWVIAVKEPNQSTWEAAQVIGSKVDTAISKIKDTKTASKGEAQVPTITGNKAADIPPIKASRPVRPKISVSPPPPAVAKTLPRPRVSPVVRETAPRPKVASLPRIPAVPVAPVKVAGIGAPPPPMPVVKARSVPEVVTKPAPVWKYEEVKGFYENASRLLAEIK